MKILRNLIMSLAIMFMASGCTIEWRDRGGYTTTTPTTVYTEPASSYIEVEYYYDDMCWEDPYWYSEEWCDTYGDGTMCCVWLVDGWYEEWCQWGYDYCWEYNGSW